jgi:hypothetical protein
MDWPSTQYVTTPILTPFHVYGYAIKGQGTSSLGLASSGTWPVNNKAFFYPFRLHTFETAYQLLFWVGATSSGNIDVGIYDSQKNRIVSSGSTAMSATVNAWQELNITDTPLPPGDYLLAGACSTTVGTVFRVAISSTADELSMPAIPVYEQTSALALPDPCTPVVCTETTIPYMAIGIQFVPTF